MLLSALRRQRGALSVAMLMTIFIWPKEMLLLSVPEEEKQEQTPLLPEQPLQSRPERRPERPERLLSALRRQKGAEAGADTASG